MGQATSHKQAETKAGIKVCFSHTVKWLPDQINRFRWNPSSLINNLKFKIVIAMKAQPSQLLSLKANEKIMEPKEVIRKI